MVQFPTRHSIVISLISFGLGALFVYVIQGSPVLDSIKTIVAGGVISAGLIIEVLGLAIEWIKGKKEEEAKKRGKLEEEKAKRREILEGYLRDHSKDVVNDVLKEWLSFGPLRRLRDRSYISAQTPLAEAHYEPYSKSRIENSIKLYSLKYADQGIDHLKAKECSKEDTHIWDIWFECESLSGSYLTEIVKIWESIEEKLTTRIPAKFVVWNGLGAIRPTCYVLNNTVLAIYYEANQFMSRGNLGDSFKIFPEHDQGHFKVGTTLLYAQSSDKSLRDEFIKIVTEIANDKSLIEQLKLLDAEKKKVEDSVGEFKQELD